MLKDTEYLNVKSTLPVLAFNFEGLKTWAEGLTARYADLVVTEEAVVDVKSDMAELNKSKAKLEEARKETVRRVSEPIREFEKQIKEIVGIFDAAYAGLGAQVKVFEDAQRNEKRKVVEGIIKEECDAAYGSGPRLNIPVQDSWLNKSASLKAVRDSVAAIIEKDLEEERRRKALKQARQDRAAAVESHVKARNQQHGLDLPLARFMGGSSLDMNIPLEQVLRGIDGVFDRAVQLREAEKEKPAPVAASTPASQPAPAPAREATGKTRAMSIVLEYDVAHEPQVKACLDTLKTLCVGFGARYRQE